VSRTFLREGRGEGFIVVAEDVAHAHDGCDLFGAETGQEVAPHRFCVDGHGRIQSLPAQPGELNEDEALVGWMTLDESSPLHPGELVREAAFVPPQTLGERLLAHLAFAKGGKTRQDSKVGSGKPGGLGEVSPNPVQYILAHEPEGMPDAKFAGGEELICHRNPNPNKNGLT
jgi:hypothetical protein